MSTVRWLNIYSGNICIFIYHDKGLFTYSTIYAYVSNPSTWCSRVWNVQTVLCGSPQYTQLIFRCLTLNSLLTYLYDKGGGLRCLGLRVRIPTEPTVLCLLLTFAYSLCKCESKVTITNLLMKIPLITHIEKANDNPNVQPTKRQ